MLLDLRQPTHVRQLARPDAHSLKKLIDKTRADLLVSYKPLANSRPVRKKFEQTGLSADVRTSAPARKTAVHLTFDLLASNRLRDTL